MCAVFTFASGLPNQLIWQIYLPKEPGVVHLMFHVYAGKRRQRYYYYSSSSTTTCCTTSADEVCSLPKRGLIWHSIQYRSGSIKIWPKPNSTIYKNQHLERGFVHLNINAWRCDFFFKKHRGRCDHVEGNSVRWEHVSPRNRPARPNSRILTDLFFILFFPSTCLGNFFLGLFFFQC